MSGGTVLVTGGAGYIGSHVLLALASRGRRCLSIDNYSNSVPSVFDRMRALIPDGLVEAREADIRDGKALRAILRGREIDSVIHLAGLKAVAESVAFPDRYYDNNVNGTRSLLAAIEETAARKIVFSSSATVYGLAEKMPIAETAPADPRNPYGRNKLDIERMLGHMARADPAWRLANLRYFNPVGAHESGAIGENPSGAPNNLMPFLCQVAAGKRDSLRIFGNDYPTPDGTGVRDYIHVMDLAEGHVAALDALEDPLGAAVLTVNLGTGRSHSVIELVEAFERVNDVRIPRVFVDRRPGDVAISYADCSLAAEVLGWKARRGLDEMCRDAWRWQTMNPDA